MLEWYYKNLFYVYWVLLIYSSVKKTFKKR